MLQHADLDLDIPQLFEQLYNFCSASVHPTPGIYFLLLTTTNRQLIVLEATQRKCSNMYIYLTMSTSKSMIENVYIYIMVFRQRLRRAFTRARHVRSIILTRRSRGGRKITFAPYLIAPFSPTDKIDKHTMVSVSGRTKTCT